MARNQEDEGQTKLQEVDVDIGQIELPKISVEKWIGKKAKITEVKTMKGEFGYLVQIRTTVLETIEGGKKPIEIRGSRIFGLQEDANGAVGWGESTKLGLYLKKMKVASPKELVGKEVILQSQQAKSGSEFLTFA